MSQVSKIVTLGRMVEKLKILGHATKDDLMEAYGDDQIQVSERTFQRDLKKLREEFYIEVSYDRGRNDYFIEEDSYSYIDTLLQFSSIVQTSQVMEQLASSGDSQVESMDVSEYGDPVGSVWLEPILKAIQQKVVLQLTYHPFGKPSKEYLLSPWLIKFNKGRWYVFGRVAEVGERVFALDRLENVSSVDYSYEKPWVDPKSFFKNTLGVYYSGEPQDVYIRFAAHVVPYQKTLPLHKSQYVVKEHENGEVTFGYTLQIDRDLLNSLMSWAGEFWVEKPEDLRLQLQSRADDLLKNLKK